MRQARYPNAYVPWTGKVRERHMEKPCHTPGCRATVDIFKIVCLRHWRDLPQWARVQAVETHIAWRFDEIMLHHLLACFDVIAEDVYGMAASSGCPETLAERCQKCGREIYIAPDEYARFEKSDGGNYVIVGGSLLPWNAKYPTNYTRFVIHQCQSGNRFHLRPHLNGKSHD